MELCEIRTKIDAVDDQLLALFLERLELVEAVAVYKAEHGLPIRNAEREQAVLDRVGERAGIRKEYACRLFSTLFQLSRDLEEERMGRPAEEDPVQ